MRRWLNGWRLALVLAALPIMIETASWAALSLKNTLRPSENPRMAEYMRRGHPLITDNEDLRAQELDYRFNPYLGFQLLPGHVYPRANPEYRSIIETDAAGFVHNGDRNVTPRLLADPAARVYRIVVLGSSVVYGLGATTNTATIPARLEARLHDRWPGVAFHVINAGVLGYQSTQERISYELYLRQLHPDALVDLTGTDAKYAAQQPQWQPHGHPGLLLTNGDYLDSFRPAPSARKFASLLLSFPEPLYSLAILHKLKDALPSLGNDTHAQDHHFYHPENALQFRRTIDGLARLVQEDKVLGLFALQPHLGGKRAELGDYERRVMTADRDLADAIQRHQIDLQGVMRELAAEHAGERLHFIDLSGAFDGVSDQTWETSSHPNDRGNDLLAQHLIDGFVPALTADLTAKGWLKPGAKP